MIISRILSITARQSWKVYYSSTENTAVKGDVLGSTICMHIWRFNVALPVKIAGNVCLFGLLVEFYIYEKKFT